MQFCDLANKAGRLSKTKGTSRGLSAIAEVRTCTTGMVPENDAVC